MQDIEVDLERVPGKKQYIFIHSSHRLETENPLKTQAHKAVLSFSKFHQFNISTSRASVVVKIPKAEKIRRRKLQPSNSRVPQVTLM